MASSKVDPLESAKKELDDDFSPVEKQSSTHLAPHSHAKSEKASKASLAAEKEHVVVPSSKKIARPTRYRVLKDKDVLYRMQTVRLKAGYEFDEARFGGPAGLKFLVDDQGLELEQIE